MHPQGYIGRKMQLPRLKETPAIEGIPDHEAVFARIKQQGLADRFSQARIIPKPLFKGLAHYPEVIGFLLERLERTLALAACY